MIYVGYQGIGKSTLCRRVQNCIDLESSNFFIEGRRHEDWYKIYANIAEHLSNQGKDVFTSSHKVLREYLNKRNIPFTVIYPALNLKDKWIEKLKERWKSTKKDKDFKAWINAVENYEKNIQDLSKEKKKVVINSINYDLINLL